MDADFDAASAEVTTKNVAVLLATVSSFLSPFMVSSTNVALPTIAAEFRMNAILLSWVPMVYIVAGAIFLLPLGKIADIYGRKKLFIYGILTFSVSSGLSAMSNSGEMLIFFRAFQGIGAAMTFGTGVAILMSVVPAPERGRALGLAIGSVYVGMSAGPFAGGFLTELLGWRSIFLASGLLAMATAVLTICRLKGEWAQAKNERFDIFGSVIYCLILASVMYGFHLLPGTAGFFFLSAGVCGSFVFIKWERKIEHPVFDWELFRHNRVFALSNLALFINYGATFAIAFLISLYLQYIKHLGPQYAGVIMVSQPILQAAFSPYAGRLSDRVEPQIVASCGMGLTVIGLVLFVFLKETSSLWFIVGTLALHGLGFALFSSPNTKAAMGSVEPRLYGVASGIVSTMRLMGNYLSIGIAMFIFSIYIGQVRITSENYGAFLMSIRVIFVVFACLCLGGVFASLARGKSAAEPVSSRE